MTLTGADCENGTFVLPCGPAACSAVLPSGDVLSAFCCLVEQCEGDGPTIYDVVTYNGTATFLWERTPSCGSGAIAFPDPDCFEHTGDCSATLDWI